MADVISKDVRDRGTETCALCGRSGDLQASHIIPKFVVKWLKDTSATSSLARIDGNNVEHAQDLPTYRMLCSDCEQRFSVLEKSFAEKIFYPFHNSGDSRLEYGSWLERLAISLGWRVLRMEYEAFKSNHPKFGPQIELAEATWREFLLGNRHAVHPYESHLLILGSIDTSTGGIHEKANWYMRRSTDGTMVTSDTRIYTYAKLADMVFVTAIQPNVMKGWKGTRINESGVIASPRTIDDDGDFGGFLQSRIEIAHPHPLRPSPAREKRFQKAVQKDRKRVLESDSIQIETEQMISRYKQRMAGMPPSVIELVDVIGNQVADTRAETVTNIWKSKKILDALADLSEEEAAAFESGVQKAIHQLFATGHSTEYRLRANTIWITFIANHNSTKADQHAVIAEELAKIRAKRPNDDMPIAIFSMNHKDDAVSWESGFLVPADTSP